VPHKPSAVGGVKGHNKYEFLLLAFFSPLRAREAPACLSRRNGMVGELQFLRTVKETIKQIDDGEDHCEGILQICKKGAD
jgi:hypothetical protein